MLAGVWYSMLLADALLRISDFSRNRIPIPTGPSRRCQTLHAASTDLRADAGYPDLFAQRSIATLVDPTLVNASPEAGLDAKVPYPTLHRD